MGIDARLVDFNHLHDTTSTQITYVNDFDITNIEERERLSNMLFTHYEGDSLGIVPQCQCGNVSGSFNEGVRCDVCGTDVMVVTERPLESALWIRPPTGAEVWISPVVYTILENTLEQKDTNVLRFLIDPNYQIPKEAIPKLPDNLVNYKQRGINDFYRNFDEIIEFLQVERLLPTGRAERETFLEFIRKYRNVLFCKALPVPSNLNFITERTITGSYVDDVMVPMVNAVHTVSQTEHNAKPLSERSILARAAKANALIANFYTTYARKHYVKKTGWFRKHIFGGRLAFSMRAVITSLSGVHDYEELHVPWTAAVGVFKIHLISKLIQRNYTPNQAVQFVNEYTARYHPLMDDLFTEILNERPNQSIETLLNRNPTLLRGSIQNLRITKVKPDVSSNSISLSTLVLQQFNGDFDGGVAIVKHP